MDDEETQEAAFPELMDRPAIKRDVRDLAR
jgi:hypothetical protein